MDITTQEINNKIYTIRNVQVMLDSDLAKLYNSIFKPDLITSRYSTCSHTNML